MLMVAQLCLTANNILFVRKGNHARRYSFKKKLGDKMKEKNKELKKLEAIITKTNFARKHV